MFVFNFVSMKFSLFYEVTIDDGIVTYSVSTPTYAEAEAVQNAASATDFASQVTTDLDSGDSGIIVESASPNSDIDVVISATVDTTDATGTADPSIAIADIATDYGLTESEQEGNIQEQKPHPM
eukprot:UN04062